MENSKNKLHILTLTDGELAIIYHELVNSYEIGYIDNIALLQKLGEELGEDISWLDED